MFAMMQRIEDQLISMLKHMDGLPSLLMRLYLVPVLWMAGSNKLMHLQATIDWFANPETGLGLPFAQILAPLAAGTEVLGALLLLLGLGTRLISIPLMAVMVVAALTVHLENGWYAIATQDHAAAARLAGFMGWLKQTFPGRHGYVQEYGRLVVLNNGVEFAATYFIMLLALFFSGSGRYVSVDYWLARS